MTAPVKVAFVGAGAMANEHARAFRAIPGVTLAGITSRSRARAEALASTHGIAIVTDSIAELHERTRADLVVVAVPEVAANVVACACFAHPWSVLLEKPAGLDLADAEAIHSAAIEADRRVWVAFNRRFLSSTRTALKDLSTVEGRRFVHVQDQQDLAQAAALGHPEAVQKAWMYANSIHVVDYLRVFGRGHVTRVTPVAHFNPDDPSIVLATVDFSSGDIGLYEGIWNGPGPWAVAVTTAARRWEMRPLEQATFQNAGERKRTEVEVHAWDRELKPGFRLQAQQVVAAVRGEASDAPLLSDSLETMRLIRAIFEQ